MTAPFPTYLTVREAAALIGISESSVRRLIAPNGVLAARKRGRDWDVEAGSARAYAARERRPGRPRITAVSPAEVADLNAERISPGEGWDAFLERLDILAVTRSDMAGKELIEALSAAGYDHLAELIYDGLEIRE